jgi:phage terminase large subunit GpA-like protein
VLGFWIHGTMSPWVPWSDLARRYVAALQVYERTKKADRLREVSAKVLGEVYEGGAENAVVDPNALRERAQAMAIWRVGTVPDGVWFVTAAVDVGHRKFDVMIVGWDLEGRSWIIDRWTITTRRVGGRDRDIRPAERQDDWLVLEEQVLNRVLPLESDPTMRMPVAGMAVDVGDGHVTWKGHEFARRMARKSQFWGKAGAAWQKVRPIKGSKRPDAPEVPEKGRKIDVDEQGKPVTPILLEFDLGVWKLKSQAIERLAETEGGPGQVTFAHGLPRSTFEEFGGEVLIDGKWERRGPNESLDLFGYNEAVRLMLRPDRAAIKWETRPPIWARPVPINNDDEKEPVVAGSLAAAATKPTALDRLAALNRR